MILLMFSEVSVCVSYIATGTTSELAYLKAGLRIHITVMRIRGSDTSSYFNADPDPDPAPPQSDEISLSLFNS
jgi:hypothetical protein